MTIVPSACNAANKGDIASTVLMPGDPLRAKYIAEKFLDDSVMFNDIRNMFGYTGKYKGKKVSVMGSGMGIPSFCLYAHELYNYFDVEKIIRVGTAGAISDKLKLRDVVIAASASTDSNYANKFRFPGYLSPAADFEMALEAYNKAKEKGINAVPGQVFTSDSFYHAMPDVNEKIKEKGILAVDMETAGLYLEAMHSKKKALSILTISDIVLTQEGLSPEERQASFDDMVKIALEIA